MVSVFCALPAAGETLREYVTPYYVIHSDLEEQSVKEAAIRMTKMAEEYHERTSAFSGVIRQRLPFYLFRNAADYYAAGALPNSDGVFMVRGADAKLMATVQRNPAAIWHIVQHEGFHQFAHAVIGGDLPVWVNEGLAEYFGESVFTGDGFVTGVIPAGRMKRVQQEIRNNRFHSVKDMMLMSKGEWNAVLNVINYDQAWSMVHFLAHGQDGKFKAAFSGFMTDIGRKTPWAAAWERNFGSAEGFEKQWSEWWLNLPDNPTADLYAQADLATFNSFLARAVSRKQTFATLDEFFRAAQSNQLFAGSEDWLPPTLIERATQSMQSGEAGDVKWSLELDKQKRPRVAAVLPDKKRLIGLYTISGSRVYKVSVEVDDVALVIDKVQALLADKKKSQARAMAQEALLKHPDSPGADELRKLLPQTR
jgi:hypothetical protein